MATPKHKTGLPLFDAMNDPRKMYRRADPITSEAAAVEMVARGKADVQRATCLRCVMAFPGHTAAEIAQMCGLERHVPSRRLPELRRVDLVENREVRVCSVAGRMSMTWYPVGERKHEDA